MKLHQVQQAAVALFAARGFAATGIRDIGRLVGLNSATLYHYTGSKEDLLVGIMRAALEELTGRGHKALERSNDPVLQLGYLVSTHVGLTALNPLTSRVIDHELRSLSSVNHDKLVAIRDEYEAQWSDVFTRGAGDGEFSPVDNKLSRLAVIEMCNGVANWFNPGGELAVHDIQERFVDLAGRMVGVENLSERLETGFVVPRKYATEPVTAIEDLEGEELT